MTDIPECVVRAANLPVPEWRLPPPPDFTAPRLPRSMHWKIRLPPGPITWRVMKSPRAYQCSAVDGKGRRVPCGGHVRIRQGGNRPGVYRRVCKKCGGVSWFELAVLEMLPSVDVGRQEGTLRFMWITEEEALEYIEQEKEKLK